MTHPKRGLGRGLDALIASSGASVPVGTPLEPPPVARRGGPEELDIDLISPNPEQPRTHFEPEQMHELAESIREHGIIQPLGVSRDGGADAEMLELALVENIQRADLNPVEEAMAFRRLTEEYGLTQDDVARRVGK